jgi:Transposase
MPMRKVDEKVKAAAIARVQAGEPVELVARSLGVTRQSVYNWTKHGQMPNPQSAPKGVPPVSTASPTTTARWGPPPPSVVKSTPTLTPVPTAGGWGGAGVEAAPVGNPTVADGDFCVETIGGIKKTIGNLACMGLGLDPAEREIHKELALSPFAEETIRVNAALIAPELRKHIGGLAMVGVALSIDVFASSMAIYTMYKIKYPPKPKKEGVTSDTGSNA